MSAAKSKPPRKVWFITSGRILASGSYATKAKAEAAARSLYSLNSLTMPVVCYVLADAPKPRKRATKRKPKA